MRFSQITLLALLSVCLLAGPFALAAGPVTVPANSSASESSTAASQQADAGRSRLTELFIWKTSEELKLPTEVETRFGDKVRAINEKRRANGERLERAIRKLDEASKSVAPAGSKSNKAIEVALTEYRNTLKELHKIQDDEVSQMRGILGAEKLARYLIVKNEITEKLRTFLARPETAPQTKESKLETPKVIEEK